MRAEEILTGYEASPDGAPRAALEQSKAYEGLALFARAPARLRDRGFKDGLRLGREGDLNLARGRREKKRASEGVPEL